jgi:hypothetical protein
MARKPTPPQTFTLPQAVGILYGAIEDLANELQDWADNMPENMQDSDKHAAVEDAAGELEGVDEPDVPEVEGYDPTVSFKFGNPKYMSKTNRLCEIEDFRSQILSVVEELKCQISDLEEEEHEELIEELDTLIGELEGLESTISVDWS